ncbi:MazG-like family protein [Streptomyces sp. NPDC004629]|uniref:MazG-like family protein n=1 Tax=Streptomyces sp. NPDC004629 TaxID=3364705 RepID=UPI0036A27A58
MDKTQWETIGRLVEWLDKESPVTGEQAKMMRVLKIGEEFGEVAEALHGALGANPRKGRSHTWTDVEKELTDVIVTAMVALATIAPDPQRVFQERLDALIDRVMPEPQK